MKRLYLIYIRKLLAFSIIFISSCKKEALNLPGVSSLTVVNTVISGKSIRIGSIVTSVANNSSSQLILTAGEADLYVWPVGDSANPYYTNPKFFTEERNVYSLFIAGQIPNITGVILKDNIPYHSDSTCGVRFINLSPNSPALNITLSTSTGVNQVNNLGYLQNTDFKIYPAKSTNTSYTFQFRRASDNSIIATYLLSTPRFTNVTLAIRGLVGGSPAFGITRVNNDR